MLYSSIPNTDVVLPEYSIGNTVSIGGNGSNLISMRTLASYVIQRREALGLKQNELALRADLPANMVNRIEKGVTKLPSPDFRRRLAKGLGVSHLDILVAAGELEPEEVRSAGAEGVVDERPVPIEVRELIQSIDWTQDNILSAVNILRLVRDVPTARDAKDRNRK